MRTRLQTQKLLISFCALLLVASCAQTQKVATDTNTVETIVSSTPPFQTKEPEHYRATRTITTVTADGATTVTKNLIARDGERRRDEPEMRPQRMVFIYGPEGKFLLLPEAKAFVELTDMDQPDTSANEDDTDASPDRLLHTGPITTRYQKIGAETVNGRGAQKYRVVVNSSADTNVSPNETLIWIDETLQMPIKSETNSGDGKRVTMELTEISLDVERALFVVPQDYRKITYKEFLNTWNNVKKFGEIHGEP